MKIEYLIYNIGIISIVILVGLLFFWLYTQNLSRLKIREQELTILLCKHQVFKEMLENFRSKSRRDNFDRNYKKSTKFNSYFTYLKYSGYSIQQTDNFKKNCVKELKLARKIALETAMIDNILNEERKYIRLKMKLDSYFKCKVDKNQVIFGELIIELKKKENQLTTISIINDMRNKLYLSDEEVENEKLNLFHPVTGLIHEISNNKYYFPWGLNLYNHIDDESRSIIQKRFNYNLCHFDIEL